jgi:hypothetical protein
LLENAENQLQNARSPLHGCFWQVEGPRGSRRGRKSGGSLRTLVCVCTCSLNFDSTNCCVLCSTC